MKLSVQREVTVEALERGEITEVEFFTEVEKFSEGREQDQKPTREKTLDCTWSLEEQELLAK